jgi:hypothetical protein
LLAGLVMALLACLLVIAWLLGRESGRHLVESSRPGVTVPSLTPAPAGEPLRGLPTPVPPAPAPTVPQWSGSPPDPARPDATVPAATQAPASAEAAAVARYFAELEALSSARYWDDPQTLAMSIVQELAGGGSSRIDRLAEVQAEVESKVRSMSVPAPCREHHRRSLELFGAAARLLQAIGRSAAAGDLAGVTAAAAEAERLQSGASELRDLENGLRARYGLPRAAS